MEARGGSWHQIRAPHREQGKQILFTALKLPVGAGLIVSAALDADDKFSYTFTAPGTCVIACSQHSQMSETIVVE
jgi:hypothetical protein